MPNELERALQRAAAQEAGKSDKTLPRSAPRAVDLPQDESQIRLWKLSDEVRKFMRDCFGFDPPIAYDAPRQEPDVKRCKDDTKREAFRTDVSKLTNRSFKF